MKSILIGLDAFDPDIFESLANNGKLPNLQKYFNSKGYARLKISNPAQSEVSWTSIASGLNPGSHGIFDFVHRNPKNYLPYVSLLPTKDGLAGSQFTPPYSSKTIFDHAVRSGYPATVLWWPATFPARPESPIKTIPGLGTPDINGRLGVGAIYTIDDNSSAANIRKTMVRKLTPVNKHQFSGVLRGPGINRRGGEKFASEEFHLEIKDNNNANIFINNQEINLSKEKWSPIIEVGFKIGMFYKLHAITRIILTQISPSPQLYFLPLQIHPMRSPWRYATPKNFVNSIWHHCGPFLSLGWPQDTLALEEGCINEDQFLKLCSSIFETRFRIMMHNLNSFREGIFANVFDTLDRVQHMYWRDRKDIIEDWYIRLDAMIGRVQAELAKDLSNDTHLVIISDHGFKDFNYKVNLNRWLIEHGYLVPRSREQENGGNLKDVDWTRSKAYAIGLNSIYLNRMNREGYGIVNDGDVEQTIRALKEELQNWTGPDKRQVVRRTYSNREAFHGSLAKYGPDMVIGYSAGYRASQKTGLGEWEPESLEVNNDHWNADHCIDPELVPGVLFSSRGLSNYSKPSYQDIPALVVGDQWRPEESFTPPPDMNDEDEEAIEERLRSLGYL